MTFGKALEAEMEEKAATAKTDQQRQMRRMQVLGHWLDLPDAVRFRSASAGTKG